jgi:hypothetical protein
MFAVRRAKPLQRQPGASSGKPARTQGDPKLMNTVASQQDNEFIQAFRGSFTSALRWHQLDGLWGRVRAHADEGWYIYAVGTAPPAHPSSGEDVRAFVGEIDTLLRKEHEEDYCGIVYADDLQRPAFIKIYDPHNLGVSCGFSDNPPLPGWIMSKIPPVDLPAAHAPTVSRRHWWQRLFGA